MNHKINKPNRMNLMLDYSFAELYHALKTREQIAVKIESNSLDIKGDFLLDSLDIIDGTANAGMIELITIQPKDKMKECTLQEAVELCKEKGGRFKQKGEGNPAWLVKEKYEDGELVHEIVRETGEQFPLIAEDFSLTWIYEPPKQSAFQKWNSTTEFHYHNSLDAEYDHVFELVTRERKAAFNRALDEVISLMETGEIQSTHIAKVKGIREV
jgi:hypothetical protein